MANQKDWIYSTSIYEVNVRQYTKEGSFNAFVAHLPRLKEMGIETLWFMPITPISEKEKKGTMGSYYACSDYVSINPEFGTLGDFKNLVAEAHRQGFKIIIDWVANHTGWDHSWTKVHPEWFEREPNGVFRQAPGMDDIIELDFSNVEMRRAMIAAMKFWVEECDIDGFRCDLAFWVQLDFWLEAIPEVSQLKTLFWLAEMDPLEHPEYMQVFDAAYAWAWMHKTAEWYSKNLELKELIHVLTRYENVTGIKAWFTSNHDENSWNGTEYEKYGYAAKALAVHSCTWPGIPIIYSGQELPLTRRLKFFDKDAIDWKERLLLHDFYRSLLNLRQSNPALQTGSEVYRLHTSSDGNILAYARKQNEKEVVVLLNLSAHLTRFDLLSNWLTGSFTELFTGIEIKFPKQDSFEMKAWEYLVFSK